MKGDSDGINYFILLRWALNALYNGRLKTPKAKEWNSPGMMSPLKHCFVLSSALSCT